MKHLVSLDDWDLGNYKDFFNLVTAFKLGDIYCPNKNLILCNLFYEPSTRTSSSFASAMWRIGGQVLINAAFGLVMAAVIRMSMSAGLLEPPSELPSAPQPSSSLPAESSGVHANIPY